MSSFIAEGVVILVSILLAFALDGWRDDREEDRGVRQELESVRRELERNQELVRVELLTLGRILSANEAFVRILDEAGARSAVQVPDTLVFLATRWHTSFSPSLGGLDALLASGRLAQIDDPELRLGLAGLRDAIDDALEDELIARDIGVNQLMPAYNGSFPFGSVGREFFHSESVGLTTQERSEAVPARAQRIVEFPTRPEVRNLIVSRWGWYTTAESEFLQLQTRLEGLLNLVSAELDNGG